MKRLWHGKPIVGPTSSVCLHICVPSHILLNIVDCDDKQPKHWHKVLNVFPAWGPQFSEYAHKHSLFYTVPLQNIGPSADIKPAPKGYRYLHYDTLDPDQVLSRNTCAIWKPYLLVWKLWARLIFFLNKVFKIGQCHKVKKLWCHVKMNIHFLYLCNMKVLSLLVLKLLPIKFLSTHLTWMLGPWY